ncbi:MAG TPA: NYN domain-containing protein [Candidatus Krumholzibacteria bacterium]|nr:NYN domain-containing protein [Candidatus Krumholzibacteria bacterium]HPD70761.1 NYN domain-containing protein [Candidatus Krumholzibacteria bacterium]HRY39539.1 NYN domain-containing protein [Candidatus Krumholzibacteria bacterium]
MSQSGERNLALFIDFDNVALGARDSRQRFDVRLLMQRVLEKGKVVVKRAYADWHYYKEHMTPLHEAAIELIEVPAPKISGKNSADIRLVVDAIDLCYSKSHIDTFVIVSGDSDFSPLVSKLRENDKRVIGIGVRSSSSHLLIANCDEFIFYDDIYHTAVTKLSEKVSSVPQDMRRLFDFLLQTTQSLLQESRGVLYSSLIKDTMKRKQPEFNETKYGYTTFGELLEDARDRGLLEVERDSRAGGTLVVIGLGKGEPGVESPSGKTRRRRRDRQRREDRGEPRVAPLSAATSAPASGDPGALDRAAPPPAAPAFPAETGGAPRGAGGGEPAASRAQKKAGKRGGRKTGPRRATAESDQKAPRTAAPGRSAKKSAKKAAKKSAGTRMPDKASGAPVSGAGDKD